MGGRGLHLSVLLLSIVPKKGAGAKWRAGSLDQHKRLSTLCIGVGWGRPGLSSHGPGDTAQNPEGGGHRVDKCG